MPYEERVGQSKLSVVRDGVRFLRAIFSGVLSYGPERILLAGFVVCMLGILLLAQSPTEFYVSNRYLEDWMIYRFVASYVLFSFGILLLLSTALIYRMAILTPRRPEAVTFWPSVVASMCSGWPLCGTIGTFLLLSVIFLFPGIVEYVTTRRVSLHWSRLLAGALTLSTAFEVAVFALLFSVVAVWKAQKDYWDSAGASTHLKVEN